jgi:hypothetical protein
MRGLVADDVLDGDRTCSVGSERCRTEESGRGFRKLVDEARDKVEKRPE